MNASWVRVFVLAVLAGCGSGDDDGEQRDAVTERSQQCVRVRDHLIELRLATSHGLREEELQQHRDALSRAFDASFLENCTTTATDASLGCVLDATDSQAAAACLVATSPTSGAKETR